MRRQPDRHRYQAVQTALLHCRHLQNRRTGYEQLLGQNQDRDQGQFRRLYLEKDEETSDDFTDHYGSVK